MSTEKRSIPPASPHRAGHYSGLHPEDQPYQSMIMAVQQVPQNSEQLSEPDVIQRDTQKIVLPAVASLATLAEPEQDYLAVPPTHYTFPTYLPPPTKVRRRFVPVMLTVSCLILLLASSLLAYIFINKRPVPDKQILNVVPDELRVNDTFTLSGSGFGLNDLISFTHEYNRHSEAIRDGSGKALQVHADDRGTFSVQIVVPTSWEVGQHAILAIDIGREQSVSVLAMITIKQSSFALPQLQLSTPTLDIGADVPGTVSKKTMTLINSGGEQLAWQASSDQPWLTVSPGNGVFSGSAGVEVTVNRGTLTPQGYTGHITFRQQGSSGPPLKLTVTMVVKSAPPASLTVAPAALTYVGTATQNPNAQEIILQNSNDQPVNWSSDIGNSASWLTINPSSDHLAAHSSETIMVSAQSQQLAVGAYQGTINFKGGVNPQVTVALTVAAPGNLIVSPPALTFSSLGQNPLSQPLTIQNSGGQAVNWTVSATTVDGANWLNPTPASGYLDANQTATITIAVNATTLKPHSYQGTLTFTYGSLTTQVAVALTVSVPPVATISLSQSALSFTTIKGTNPASASFTITNTGNATLNWTIAEDQIGQTFVPLSSSSGSLAPTKSTVITVSPSVAKANGGTLNSTITVLDSDSGTKVASQKINVSVLVKDQAVISVSTNAMPPFNHDSQVTSSAQFLTITNTGSSVLNLTLSSTATWLSFDNTSGTLDPGTAIVISVGCDSSSLAVGTYTTAIVVIDSDTGTPVASQTVTVTLVVS